MSLKTPTDIRQHILKKCLEITANEPFFIEVRPWINSNINDCFNNVRSYLKDNDGRIVYGWKIKEFANCFIDFEFHAVVLISKNSYLDITPDQSNKILFMEDDHLKFEGKQIDNIRLPIRKTKLILQYLSLWEDRYKLLNNGPNEVKFGRVSVNKNDYESLMNKIIEIEQILNRYIKIGPNEKCPCGSNRKFKKCCY